MFFELCSRSDPSPHPPTPNTFCDWDLRHISAKFWRKILRHFRVMLETSPWKPQKWSVTKTVNTKRHQRICQPYIVQKQQITVNQTLTWQHQYRHSDLMTQMFDNMCLTCENESCTISKITTTCCKVKAALGTKQNQWLVGLILTQQHHPWQHLQWAL